MTEWKAGSRDEARGRRARVILGAGAGKRGAENGVRKLECGK